MSIFKRKVESSAAGWYGLGMIASQTISLEIPGAPSLLEVTREYVGKVCAACDALQRWEREQLLEKPLSPEESQMHRNALKGLIRAVRVIDALVSDPDFPDPSLHSQLEFEIWRLNQSWEYLNNPMSDDEAGRILRAAFPEDPLTGKLFPNASGA